MTASGIRSVNPARPDETIGTFPAAGSSEVDDAVRRAAEAQRDWARTPVPVRGERILAAKHVLEHHKPQLAELVSREVGKVLVEGGGDVQEAVDMAGFVAGMARMPMGDLVPCELPDKFGLTTRQPVGVVGLITAWNFPVAVPSWKLFPALLAGNGIVLKPSEYAPACAEALCAALYEAGIPEALVRVVHGTGDTGAALVEHPDVRAVSFTGSVPTGRLVAAAAATHGPKMIGLELGGKNAMVVLSDADLELVGDGAIFGAFGTSGQRCTSTSRLVVHRDVAHVANEIASRASKLVLGDPCDPSTDVGPLITHSAAERVHAMVRHAVAQGAEVLCGGEIATVRGCDGGAFYRPTVLTGIRPDHDIAQQEVFGPVLAVIEVGSAEEAVDVVNASEYGLSAAVYTRDLQHAMRTIDGINTGIVYVNAPTIGSEVQLPFGGTKHTGNGFREAGLRGIEQFSQIKSIYIDYSGRLQRAQIDTRPPTQGAT